MKKIYLTISILLFFNSILAQQKIEIKDWLAAGPKKVFMPLFNNHKNVDGETFKQSDLLKSVDLQLKPWNIAEGKKITLIDQVFQFSKFTVATDSLICTGIDSNYLEVMATHFLTSSWSNPKIKVKTDAFCEIYIDGKLEKSKTTSNLGEISFSSKLDAGKHQLIVKLLSSAKQIKFNATIEQGTEYNHCLTKFSLEPNRNTTIEDILDGEKINSALISPSGNYLIIHTNLIQNGTGKSIPSFLIKDIKNKKDIITLHNQRINQVQWLPRSDKFSYTVITDQLTDIYVFDLISGNEVLIASGLNDFSYYKWAPNEEFIVFTTLKKAEKPGDLKRIFNNDDRIPDSRNRNYLNLLYINNGISLPISTGNKNAYLQDIHPESTKILFTTNRTDYTEVPFSKQDLYELDLKTFNTDTIWKDKKYGGSASYSPDGKKLLVEGAPECFGNIGVNVGQEKIPNSYDSQLFIFDLATRAIQPITLNFEPAVLSANWINANDIYMTVTEKDYQNLYLYNVKNENFTKIEVKTDVIERIDYAYFQNLAVYSGTSVCIPQKLYLINLKTRQNIEVYFPEKERFEIMEYGKTEDWNFVNKNKKTIYGRIYYPVDYDQTKKYPVIVNYYGGTTPTSRDFGGRYPKNIWAANGYMVYVLQPSGATGFGQEFSALHVNGWGFDAIDDIIEGTKKFLETHPSADSDNVGCIGASYGGYTTMLLQTRTDIFKTAISHAGISSITSYWGEGYWGYSYSAGATAYSYPWNRQDIYVKNSPVYNADKFNNSILLLHGTADTNVPVGESLQFYAALKILGKDVEMVLVDGENHHILDYKKRIKWHNTIMAWFDYRLKGQAQQWLEMYPEKNL